MSQYKKYKLYLFGIAIILAFYAINSYIRNGRYVVFNDKWEMVLDTRTGKVYDFDGMLIKAN